MRNVTVRSSLMGALALFASMIVFGAAVGVFTLGRADESTVMVHDISARVIGINDAYKDTARTRSALNMAYIALKEDNDETRKTTMLDKSKVTYERALKQIEEFDKLPPYKGQDDKLKADLVDAGKQLEEAISRASAALRANDTAAYAKINGSDIDGRGTNFSKLLEKFDGEIKSLAQDLVTEREREYSMVVWMVAIGLIGALALVLAVHFLLRSIVLKPLNEAVDLLDQVANGDLSMHVAATSSNEIGRLFSAIRSMQQSLLNTVSRVRSSTNIINSGAKEIASGNMDLSARTETQASSLQQTAASMEQLTGTVKQNADNALQANQLALSASETAVKGGEVVAQVVDTMEAINTSSKKIVDIISVIDGIAFQTNILALNAAVEAARAGEQGRGFAVVASEVRSLAQRSASAAKEIKELISDSVEKVESGSRLVEHAGMTMGEVVDSVRRVTDIVGEISSASREQSAGIVQVNQAITQMDAVTQQNAALVEQAAAAAKSLQNQATVLSDAVSIFRIDAKQASTALTGAAAPASASVSVKAPATPAASAAAPKKEAVSAIAASKPASRAVVAPARPAPKLPAPVGADDDWEQF
ncbi:methyl-accepting chemotaxis protein [Herbaspirillum sp. Sphag1AN]|uniref:methyl-accepting chemotaxis protein n=1 Tax=unclassified Herbaspirillum TaxID=2624150 RepID=UPI0016192A9B|nr:MULTISPECIES: methyl-accepting chemotaxis protein [unclassified Herbaspirillum]MBB3213388.1 methyl-accepting chemotaxis protein [Herbaspirillum sp. Sphag1AN]MBB3246568.1 methyl-accepting chemotaxis protein [Herbaspirillum sp. Sphag64]